jgi:ATP/maltotriose-dependent transcriptional regulator MalT
VLNNQYEEAAPRLELALDLSEALGLQEVFCQALTSKSILYTSQNRLEEARILLEGALDLALTNDLHAAAVRATNNLAVNHESRDRYRDAADIVSRGLELARRVGDRVWEEIFLYGVISSLVLLGEWDEALARDRAADEGKSVESVEVLLLFVAWVDCARGNIEGGRARVDSQSALKTSDDPQARMGYASTEAHVLRAEGRFDEALAVAESGIAFKDELGTTFLTVKLCYVEALESAFALGDRAKVESLLDEIESLRLGERPPLLEAHAQRFRSKLSGDEAGYRVAAALFREHELILDLGCTLLEHGEATGSETLLAEARSIFERLGATPWLERAAGPSSEAVVA